MRSWLRRTLTGQCLTRDYTARPSQAGQKGTRNAPTASRRTMGRQAASTTPTPQSLAGFKAPHNSSSGRISRAPHRCYQSRRRSKRSAEISTATAAALPGADTGMFAPSALARTQPSTAEIGSQGAPARSRSRVGRNQPPPPPPAKPSLATRSNRRGRPGQAAATSLNLYLARYSRRRRR